MPTLPLASPSGTHRQHSHQLPHPHTMYMRGVPLRAKSRTGPSITIPPLSASPPHRPHPQVSLSTPAGLKSCHDMRRHPRPVLGPSRAAAERQLRPRDELHTHGTYVRCTRYPTSLTLVPSQGDFVIASRPCMVDSHRIFALSIKFAFFREHRKFRTKAHFAVSRTPRQPGNPDT